ncbi:MAG TPA: cytochrome c3 family protein [Thermoanaerobaculia bacterium]|nr:cytochrome c3 family protein [Thermoanaerobaculia bacterium]
MTGPHGFVKVFVAMIFIAAPLFAGEWHYGASMVCSDCHTQHNSSGGVPMRTDSVAAPAAMLLRRGTAQELCLSCHAGANASAPDVIAPVTYVSESAAGAFPASHEPSSMAHDLLSATPVIPPGGTVAMVLQCTTCHDPHGNQNYRNLRPDPTRSGLPGVTVVSHQGVTANGSNPAQVYVRDNVIYKSGVSAWCATCHGAPVPGSDHPDDTAIWGATLADYTLWSSSTLPHVPVHSPSDNVVPSVDDRVICISCHKAHGSDHPAAMIYADGETMESTCQECHGL